MKIAWAYPANIIDAIEDNDLGYHPSPAQLAITRLVLAGI